MYPLQRFQFGKNKDLTYKGEKWAALIVEV